MRRRRRDAPFGRGPRRRPCGRRGRSARPDRRRRDHAARARDLRAARGSSSRSCAGRHFSEVADIVPRICGICPVAYQMTAIHGLERLFEVEVPAGTHELRRLLYCAEWIESHMLHVHLLAAPDFLGFDSAIEMAQKGFKPQVERGLRLKRIGNDLMAAIGGREIHPVSPMVGGFSRAATKNELRAFEGRLEDALAGDPRRRRLRRAARDARLPARRRARLDGQRGRVPDERRRDGVDARPHLDGGRRTRHVTEEVHVAHSNALHSVFTDTQTPYFVGPLARVQPERGDAHAGGARGRRAGRGSRPCRTSTRSARWRPAWPRRRSRSRRRSG